MKDLKELRRKRGALVQQMRGILDKAETEKRDLTAEERQEYERLDGEQTRAGEEITREERQQELEREALRRTVEPNRPDPENRGQDNPPENRNDSRATREYRDAWARWAIGGFGAVTVDERRALQADVDTAGGFTRPPTQFVADLIKALDNEVFIRGLATVSQVTQADGVGRPEIKTDPDDADWTAEITSAAEDSSMDFGKREIHPHPLSKLLKVSRKLIRVSAVGIEQLVRDRLAYKLAVPEEKGFLTGSGAGQPLGVFTASADGISTSRDVSDGNTATSIGADGLINAKYTLKSPYWPRSRWVFHRDAVKQVQKLKDGNGQYIWQPGLSSGAPDRILDVPFLVSEYAPNTFTTDLYVGIIGDFKNYWIVEAMGAMEIQRLDELYARTNQVGFIARAEVDGAPVLEEAFVRVKLA